MAEVKSQGAVEAMDVAESARETEWEKPSFVGDLFLGKLNLDLIHPFPEQPEEDRKEADEFLSKFERFLAKVDGMAARVHLETVLVGDHRYDWLRDKDTVDAWPPRWVFQGGERDFKI